MRALVVSTVDGLALVGTDHSPQLYEFLGHAGLPWSCCGRSTPAAITIASDSNRRPAMRATQHRDFAMIAAHILHNDCSRGWRARRIERARRRASRASLRRVGFTPYQAVARHSATCSRRVRPPTAIVCGNHLLAVGVVLECAGRGIDVPASMSSPGSTTSTSPRRSRPRARRCAW